MQKVANRLAVIAILAVLAIAIFGVTEFIYSKGILPIQGTSNNISNNIVGVAAGQRISNFQVLQVNPSNVIGLLYIEYPVAYANGTRTAIYIGNTVGYACDGSLAKLVSIQNSTAFFMVNITTKSKYGCPI